MGYLKDLRSVLQQGTVAERRALLLPFVQEVVKSGRKLMVRYALPLPPETLAGEGEAVLDFVRYGGR